MCLHSLTFDILHLFFVGCALELASTRPGATAGKGIMILATGSALRRER
jgi:hypothetical protein